MWNGISAKHSIIYYRDMWISICNVRMFCTAGAPPMTADKAQQPEYIITEDQLSKIEKRYIPGEYGLRIIKDVRTRPHPPAPSQNAVCLCSQCNYSAKSAFSCRHTLELPKIKEQAASAATLAAYDEFLAAVRVEEYDNCGYVDMDSVEAVYVRLRQQAGEQG